MPRRMPPAVLLCLILSGVALSGCTTPPPVRNLDTISYSERPPIRLDVREIEIQRAYQPPNAAPNVDHLFPVPPAAGAQLWAADRLKAAGPQRSRQELIVAPCRERHTGVCSRDFNILCLRRAGGPAHSGDCRENHQRESDSGKRR